MIYNACSVIKNWPQVRATQDPVLRKSRRQIK